MAGSRDDRDEAFKKTGKIKCSADSSLKCLVCPQKNEPPTPQENQCRKRSDWSAGRVKSHPEM